MILSVFISDIDQDVQGLLPGFTIIESNETPFQGHILTNKPFDPGAAVIIDNQAKIVWYYLTDDLISLVHWTTNRTILIVSNFGQKLTEVDLDGSIIFELEFGEAGFDKELHHEARLTPEGNIIALTLVSEVFDLTGIGGSSNQTVTGDGIVIFDRSGNKVWEWDVFQIKDPETDSSVLDNLQDWMHVNSLFRDDNGDYLLSVRNRNQIWKIDGNTGGLIWELGENGDFAMPTGGEFDKQHHAHINSDGELMIFNNGNQNQVSRAMSFQIDEVGQLAELMIDVALPAAFYSSRQGSSYLIEDDRLVIGSSVTTTIFVTDLNGNIIWQVLTTDNFYRAQYLTDF